MSYQSQHTRAEYGCSADAQARFRFRTLGRGIACLSILLALISGAAGQTPHLAPSLQRVLAPSRAVKCALDLDITLRHAASGRIPVIIQAANPGLAARFSHLVNAGNRNAATEAAKEKAVTALNSFGSYAAQLSREQIIALAADPQVCRISPDRALQACADYTPQAVGADTAWNVNKVTGSGITVAVLDTGLYSHYDLTSGTTRIKAWVDLVGGMGRPYDDNGHGTHVAGIIAGNGGTGSQYHYNVNMKRIAPNAQIVAVKVLDKNGSGSVSTVIAGINWCITNKARYNIRIINLSLGHPIAESYKTDPLCQACESAWKAGILVVCAAGNLGRSVPSDPTSAPLYGSIISPGNDPYVLTVGAMNTRGTAGRTDDVIASYSSRGPSAIDFTLKPDIVAPGNNVDSLGVPTSALFSGYIANQVQPSQYAGSGSAAYFRLSGTSMAAPVVAGAAALLLQADSTLTPDVIKARLMVSADKWTTADGSSDPFSFGAGYLNIPAALASRVGAPLGALSPITYLSADGYANIDNSIWGSNSVWGNNALWGNNVLANNAIWGNNRWSNHLIWSSCIWNGDVLVVGSDAFTEATSILINGD